MTVHECLTEIAQGPAFSPCAIHEYAFVSPDTISFTAAVRAACEANLCGCYGKYWTCPPGAGDWEMLRDHFKAYRHAFVFTTKHPLEDSFDVEGMAAGRKDHGGVNEKICARLDQAEGSYELLGAEGCSICEACTYPNAPCRFPEKARRSMEACGIDVVSLAADAGLHYMNGENTVTYFSIIFYN